MAEKRVSVRFSSQGGNQVIQEMEGIGRAGQQSMRQIDTSTAVTTARLQQFNRISGQNRAAIRNTLMQFSQIAQQGAVTGDFARAAAFQLPDLAMGFGTWGIAIGAVAGVLAPLIIDMARADDVAEDLDDQLQRLDETTRALRQANEDTALSYADLADRAGDYSVEVRDALEFVRQLRLDDARREVASLTSSIAEYTTFLNEDGRELSSAANLFNLDLPAFTISRSARDARTEVRALIDEIAAAQDAVGAAEGPDLQIEALVELQRIAQQAADYDGRRTEAETEYLELINRQIEAVAELSVLQDRERDLVQDVRAALVETSRARIEDAQTAAEMLQTLDQQAEMQAVVQRYGEDSVAAAELRLAAERAAYAQRVDELAITDDMKVALMAAWDNANGVASVDMAGNISLAADQAERLARALPQTRMSPFSDLIGDDGQMRPVDELLFGGMDGDIPETRSSGFGGGQLRDMSAAAQAVDQALRQAAQASLTFDQAVANLDARLDGGDITMEEYTGALDQLRDRFDDIDTDQFEQGLGRVFGLLRQVVSGADGAQQALESLAWTFLENAFMQWGQSVAPTSLLGTIFSGLMGVPSFDGGGYTGAGARSGGVDGRGGFWAIMHPDEDVIDRKAVGAGPGLQIRQTVNNYAGPDTEVRSTERMRPDGTVDQLIEIVGRGIAQGRLDGVMAGRYGAQVQAVRR